LPGSAKDVLGAIDHAIKSNDIDKPLGREIDRAWDRGFGHGGEARDLSHSSPGPAPAAPEMINAIRVITNWVEPRIQHMGPGAYGPQFPNPKSGLSIGPYIGAPPDGSIGPVHSPGGIDIGIGITVPLGNPPAPTKTKTNEERGPVQNCTARGGPPPHRR
jgi:hypothetical protein